MCAFEPPVYVSAPSPPKAKSTSEDEPMANAIACHTPPTNDGNVFAVQYHLARGNGDTSSPLKVVSIPVLPIDTAVAFVVPNDSVLVE